MFPAVLNAFLDIFDIKTEISALVNAAEKVYNTEYIKQQCRIKISFSFVVRIRPPFIESEENA